MILLVNGSEGSDWMRGGLEMYTTGYLTGLSADVSCTVSSEGGWGGCEEWLDAGAAGIQSYVKVRAGQWREIGFITNANFNFVPVMADVTHSASPLYTLTAAAKIV